MMGTVFYRWPIGLRFELGGRDDLRGVHARAAALYEAAFAPEDICIVAEGRFIPRIQAVAPSPHRQLFDVAAAHQIYLGHPRQHEVELGAQDYYDAGTWRLEWSCGPARDLGHARILEGIANSDHGIEPCIDDRVYFVAPEKGLLFYMYDDRGLDMMATDRGVLAPLYRNLNHWLLDDDRARMRAAFEDTPASGQEA